MIYDKEWKHYKLTNFSHPKGLITFQTKMPTKQPLSILEGIMKQITYFTKSIHGLSYIWEKNFRFIVRLFWFLVFAVTVIACCTMYLSLSWRLSRHQLKTVVGTSQMPIYSMNFPAVALCPWSNVNWLRYKAAEDKFLPHHFNNSTKHLFYDVLRILDETELSQLESLALLENRTVEEVIHKISLNDLAKFMAFRCEELFVECYYAETKYDCCKLFVAERTEKGLCLVFNSMASEESRKKRITDKFYPWKNRKAGERTGLQFTIRHNKTFQGPENQIPFGIDDEKSQRYDRIEGLAFNHLNCIVKCQQKNFIKICNCSLSWFFPEIDVRDCSVADFKCIYKNRDIFTYIKSPLQDDYIMDSRRGVVCDCVNSCTSLVFLTALSSNMLPKLNSSYTIIKGDIYIGQNVITKYETRLYSTAFDLIAKFGGILGLCLGASVLSLAEVVYATLKIILFLFAKLFQKPKVKPQPKEKLNSKLKKIVSIQN